MNRNLNERFSLVPDINIQRSRFDRNCSIKTSFDIGQVVPFFVDEVLPGDSFQIKTNLLARMQPMVSAPLDDLFLDTYYFFVPNRLVWQHWKEFNGENTESAWYPSVEYRVPYLLSGDTGFEIGSIADFMGLPVGVPGLEVNALPFRAYALICNEWFRDENVVAPLQIPTDDSVYTYYKLSEPYNPAQYANGGKPFIAAKAHDYFTSCLPSPQKHSDITINPAMSFIPLDSGEVNSPFTNPVELYFSKSLTSDANLGVKSLGDSGFLTAVPSGGTFPPETSENVSGSNLGVPASTFSVTINQLRQAIAIQQLYEKDARSGSRYTEILKGHFGVTSPDARLQRPEYLGGNRIPVSVNQVVQQSSSVENSPQGNVTGLSLTGDSHGDFMQSFTEHGFIIGVCVARYAHTYQQGIERMWSRKSRFDYYWPALANIGEMAVLNKEIYAQGKPVDDEVFGYQEAWSDYRYKPSRCTSEMRSNHAKTLDSWHFADDYDALPHLSSDWIQEDKANVDRVMAVTSNVSNQMFVDFYIENITTRPMPLYSVPGLERI